MICPKCGAMVPTGRNSCVNCGKIVDNKESDPFTRAERGQIPSNYRPDGYFETKPGIILAGVGELFIGIFSSIVVFLIIAELSTSIGLLVGLIIFMYGVILPTIGLLLIGIGQYSLGGNLLIAGSVLFVPIGRVGIMAGRNAKKLEGWNPN